MKNGETKVEELTAMIDRKIAALVTELDKWRAHRNHIVHAQKDLGLLEPDRTSFQPPEPESEEALGEKTDISKLGLTDAVKAILAEDKQLMYTVPVIRDTLIKRGFDGSGKNFYVILGQTLKRLAKNPNIVETHDDDGKKFYSGGKDLL